MTVTLRDGPDALAISMCPDADLNPEHVLLSGTWCGSPAELVTAAWAAVGKPPPVILDRPELTGPSAAARILWRAGYRKET